MSSRHRHKNFWVIVGTVQGYSSAFCGQIAGKPEVMQFRSIDDIEIGRTSYHPKTFTNPADAVLYFYDHIIPYRKHHNPSMYSIREYQMDQSQINPTFDRHVKTIDMPPREPGVKRHVEVPPTRAGLVSAQ